MSLCSHFLYRLSAKMMREGGGEVTEELLSGAISGLVGGLEDSRTAEITRNQTIHLRKWL